MITFSQKRRKRKEKERKKEKTRKKGGTLFVADRKEGLVEGVVADGLGKMVDLVLKNYLWIKGLKH